MQRLKKISSFCVIALISTAINAQSDKVPGEAIGLGQVQSQQSISKDRLSKPTGDRWPQVVVTNPPLHSLVAAIMGDQASPRLLFSRQLSHHHTALKPSQLRQLNGADLLVWAGGEMERPVEVVLQKNIIEVDHWSAQSCAGQRLLLVSDEGTGTDPHGWLDIDNAVCYVNELVAQLTVIDPVHQGHYQRNAARLIEQLGLLDHRLAKLFKPVSASYMGYHNSFRYLLSRYGQAAQAELNLFNEQPPRLRQLLSFRQQLKATGVACLIADSSVSREQLEQWRLGSGAQLLMLDPMGRALQPGPQLYFQLLTELAEQLAVCIAG